jgi:hypothetical protein
VALAVGNVPSVLPNVLGPGLAYENLGLQKSFTLGGDRALSFRADAFNAFNRAGRGDPVTDINNPNFGLILQTNQGVNGSFTPRIVQVQAHLNF